MSAARLKWGRRKGGSGRRIICRRLVVWSVQQPQHDVRRVDQFPPLQIPGNGRGKDLVATGKNEQFGRRGTPQRSRQLPARLRDVVCELAGIRVVPAIHRLGEGWRAAKIAHDLLVRISRSQA